MKKLIALFLAAVMLLSLAACGSTAANTAADDTDTETASTDTSAETPPELPDGETPPENPDGENGQPGDPPPTATRLTARPAASAAAAR